MIVYPLHWRVETILPNIQNKNYLNLDSECSVI